MRLTRYHLFLLGGLFLMVMGPLAFTQPGPNPGRGRGDGKRWDPAAFAEKSFQRLAGDKDSFAVATVQLPPFPEPPEKQKERMLAFLQKKGVTNGVMTKVNFTEFTQERMAEFQALRQGKKGGGGGPPAPGGPPPAPGTEAPKAPSGEEVDAKAREEFKKLDTNNDGRLSVEEMQAAAKVGSSLHAERDKWDRNKNGVIELDEYVEFYKNKAAQVPAEAAPPPEEDKRPTVYRLGKMPKELPKWFEELDRDKDGQVGLYEWKASGKSIDEFLAMDHNGDGFITAEETLRHLKLTARKSPPSEGNRATVSPGGGGTSPGQAGGAQGGNNRRRGNNRQRGNPGG